MRGRHRQHREALCRSLLKVHSEVRSLIASSAGPGPGPPAICVPGASPLRGAAEPGRTIEEIARERRCDPLDAVCDVIIADKGATRILVRSMSEADVRAIAADPSALVGSDGPCVAPYGITGQGKPHPRLYGTFPRLIGHYARDLGLLTLPQAIAKMTGGAAAALGLADRGLLAEGQAADVVLFDPATIIDRSTYDDPHQYPAGIGTVIVNGTVVIDAGEHTGALPGRLLRRRGAVLA